MEKTLGYNEQEIKKYDIVFIGGGPATISFFAYLYQHKYNEKVFGSTNILVIEKSENFGAGCLGKYGINSNTSAEGFTRLICQPGEAKLKSGKFELSPSRKPMKASKNYNIPIPNMRRRDYNNEEADISKLKPLSIFSRLFLSSSVQTLLKIGNHAAPLSLVGYFLDNLGNTVVDNIQSTFNKNIFLNKAEVKSIKSYHNEEFGIFLTKEKKGVLTNILIKTKCVIMSSGGKQATSPYFNRIQLLKGQENVYLSDHLLQENGYLNLVNNIVYNNKRKIVIIGGSHSGFSAAWMLVNIPSTYKNIKVGDDLVPNYDNECKVCPETSGCICYGKVIDRNWNIDDLLSLDNIEINILYRDHIRVFYPTEEEAVSDNYTGYDTKEALNKFGKIYPFVGIRGDAKELYRKIINKEEPRIKLIKTETNNEQTEYINNADIVIWACGYVTNSLPIYDFRGNLMEFCTDETGSIEVDKELRFMNKNKTAIKHLFGIGQGYSTKAPEVINGKKPRADSINLYNTHIANKLYKSLEGLLNKLSVDNLSKGGLAPIIQNKRRSETLLLNNFKFKKEDETHKKKKHDNTTSLFLRMGKKIMHPKLDPPLLEKKTTNFENFMNNEYFTLREPLKQTSPRNLFIPNQTAGVKKFSYQDRINYGKLVSNNIIKKNNL